MTAVYDDGATAVSEEYQLYRGLDAYFAQTQSLQTTGGIKSSLGLMVLEMDLALKSFEGGNVSAALDHHKNMLRHSRTVLAETETLNGHSAAAKAVDAKNVTADVRVLCATLVTAGGIVTGDAPAVKDMQDQPWSETLRGITAAAQQKRAENIAKMSVMSDADVLRQKEKDALNQKENKPTPAKDIPFTFGAKPLSYEGQSTTGKNSVSDIKWARREYRNLALVLEGITKQGKYSPAKREANVALSCLRILNKRENEMIARGRKGEDTRSATEYKDVTEYAARLQTYMGKLKKNEDVSDGAKMNLKRFGTPALVALGGFKKSLKAPGILSRAFHFALVTGAAVLAKKAVQTAASKPKQYVP